MAALLRSRWLPRFVSLALLLLMAYSVWGFFIGGAASEYADAAALAPVKFEQAEPRVPATSLAQQIASRNLFGKPAKPQVTDAPVTQLNLSLTGIIAGDLEATSFAIIAESGRQERVYKINDKLPGNSVLQQVLADRVIIDNSGRLETLMLPELDVGGSVGRSVGVTATAPVRVSEPLSISVAQPTPEPSPEINQDTGVNTASASAQLTPEQVSQKLGQYRKQLIKNPRSLGQLVDVEPAKEGGKTIGFRIRNIKDQALLGSLDLKPNDVITKVNGVGLDSTLGRIEAVRRAATADTLQVDIVRDGQPMTISQVLGE